MTWRPRVAYLFLRRLENLQHQMTNRRKTLPADDLNRAQLRPGFSAGEPAAACWLKLMIWRG